MDSEQTAFFNGIAVAIAIALIGWLVVMLWKWASSINDRLYTLDYQLSDLKGTAARTQERQWELTRHLHHIEKFLVNPDTEEYAPWDKK